MTYRYINTNQITSLPAFILSGCPNLVKFSAFNNTIMTIDATAFQNNARLMEVYLHDNRITSLPSRLFSAIPPGAVVNVSNNPLVSIASDTFSPNFNGSFAYVFHLI